MLGAAEHALSRLELAGEMVPSVEWFLYAFVRKEAVISSQIEGTQATLVDLFNYEAGAPPEPQSEVEVQEVCNYLDALTFARKQLSRKDGLPLSMERKPPAALSPFDGLTREKRSWRRTPVTTCTQAIFEWTVRPDSYT